ncbi:MAG: hypothetical protein KTR14_03110 [Vampirovibrio sp.]|nr:hypothetical protein [Vampirovibrio sp.]
MSVASKLSMPFIQSDMPPMSMEAGIQVLNQNLSPLPTGVQDLGVPARVANLHVDGDVLVEARYLPIRNPEEPTELKGVHLDHTFATNTLGYEPSLLEGLGYGQQPSNGLDDMTNRLRLYSQGMLPYGDIFRFLDRERFHFGNTRVVGKLTDLERPMTIHRLTLRNLDDPKGTLEQTAFEVTGDRQFKTMDPNPVDPGSEVTATAMINVLGRMVEGHAMNSSALYYPAINGFSVIS